MSLDLSLSANYISSQSPLKLVLNINGGYEPYNVLYAKWYHYKNMGVGTVIAEKFLSTSAATTIEANLPDIEKKQQVRHC